MERYTDETPRDPLPEEPRLTAYRSPIRGTHTREAYTAPRHASKRIAAKPNWRETLLMQCTVCAVLLAVALFFNVTDNRLTGGASAWLKRTLSEDAGFAVGSIWETVKNVFARDDAADAVDSVQDLPIVPVSATTEKPTTTSIPSATATPQATAPASNPDSGAERIDEDILNALQSEPDLYDQKNR